MASTIPVNALLRGLQVLEAVNAYGPVGLAQVWRQTGMPKATVLRLLESLRQAGYLSFDAQAQTYQVSLRALALANNVSHERQLLDIARPIMGRLRDRLGWPSDLAVFQHDKMVIVDTNRVPGVLSANRSIGSRVPMMASATGRIHLASVALGERTRVMETLRTSTDPYEALARDAAAAHRLLDATARRGYGLSDQEFLKTNRGAAVAVMQSGDVVCVINLIAIAAVTTIDEVKTRYVPMLLDAKAEFEEQLHRYLPQSEQADQAVRVLRHSSNAKAKRTVRPGS